MTDLPDPHDVTDIITQLRAIPAKWAQPDRATLAQLPKPYNKSSEKGKCDVCGGFHGLPAMHLDYMGHAEVTKALIDIDPLWTWEPLMMDPATGGPMVGKQGDCLVMWARLTLLGKSMIGVGTCAGNKGEAEKELIGDFLRNAAMRFGVAVDLWSKAPGASADPFGNDDDRGGYDSRPTGGQAQERRPARQRAPQTDRGGSDAPAYVSAIASHMNKGVGYVLSIARNVAKGTGVEQPRNANAITPALAILVCEKLGIDLAVTGLMTPAVE